MRNTPQPPSISRLGSVTDLMSMRSYVTGSIDHRGERYRHKRVIDALNVQTRQGIPVRRSLARLRAEAQRVLDRKIRLTDDEAKILVAALAECQLRLVLEAELELAAGLYWNAIFWQNQIKSPFAAWVEAGPFTWFQDEDESLTPEDKLDALQRLLSQASVGTGLMQQHLTRKIVNTDVGYLSAWSSEALDLIDDVLNDVVANDRLALGASGGGSMLPSRSDPDLGECVTRLGRLKAKIEERAARLTDATAPLAAPSFWRRRWLYTLVASPFLLFALKWAWSSRAEIPKWVARAIESAREFFHEHVREPSQAIAKELIWNEHTAITDVAALEDAKKSLSRMLEDFIKDSDPDMPAEEKKKLAERMDMSVVSSRYEKALPQAIKHVVTGDIVRMLLIQVQFIKKELLVAMSAIDELMDSNAINFRIMAIFPAVLAVYGAYSGAKALSYKATRRKGRRETVLLLRSFLLSMERMLNLRNVGASEDDIKYLKQEGARLVKPGAHHPSCRRDSFPAASGPNPHFSYSTPGGGPPPPQPHTHFRQASVEHSGHGGHGGGGGGYSYGYDLGSGIAEEGGSCGDGDGGGGGSPVLRPLAPGETGEDGGGGNNNGHNGGGGGGNGRPPPPPIRAPSPAYSPPVLQGVGHPQTPPAGPVGPAGMMPGSVNRLGTAGGGGGGSSWDALAGAAGEGGGGDGFGGGSYVGGFGGGGFGGLQAVFLRPEDLGVLLLFVSMFTTVIERERKRFLSEVEYSNLMEDMSEMAGNCGIVTVQQQLEIVQRMHRSYRFLQAQNSGLLSGITG